MIEAQSVRYATAIAPAAIVNDATATATPIDCKDAKYLEVLVQLGATDVAVSALKLQEDDESDGSYTDIPGATFDAGANVDGVPLALPSATDDDQTHVFQVNLDGRKRFVKVVCTFGDGSTGGYVAATARLSRISPPLSLSTERAAGGICRV